LNRSSLKSVIKWRDVWQYGASLLLLAGSLLSFAEASIRLAPQGPGRGPITAPRDPELEKQSQRNLEVAKFYFYKRKPEKNDRAAWERLNKAVESRLMEIVDTHPDFGRMDEVYFMLGEVYQRAGDLPAARENWARVAQNYPESQFLARARKRMDETAVSTGKEPK